jgi:hypothetical protein
MRQSLLLGVTVVLASCGGASPGGSCDVTGFLCFDATSAMECQLGKWVQLPCRGPSGCQRMDTTVTCDMSLNMEGDACASTAVGSGICSTDMMATLECRADTTTNTNTLKKTNTCRTCSVMPDATTGKQEVVCTPP